MRESLRTKCSLVASLIAATLGLTACAGAKDEAPRAFEGSEGRGQTQGAVNPSLEGSEEAVGQASEALQTRWGSATPFELYDAETVGACPSGAPPCDGFALRPANQLDPWMFAAGADIRSLSYSDDEAKTFLQSVRGRGAIVIGSIVIGSRGSIVIGSRDTRSIVIGSRSSIVIGSRIVRISTVYLPSGTATEGDTFFELSSKNNNYVASVFNAPESACLPVDDVRVSSRDVDNQLNRALLETRTGSVLVSGRLCSATLDVSAVFTPLMGTCAAPSPAAKVSANATKCAGF